VRACVCKRCKELFRGDVWREMMNFIFYKIKLLFGDNGDELKVSEWEKEGRDHNWREMMMMMDLIWLNFIYIFFRWLPEILSQPFFCVVCFIFFVLYEFTNKLHIMIYNQGWFVVMEKKQSLENISCALLKNSLSHLFRNNSPSLLIAWESWKWFHMNDLQ
jgi:hypothetical protein